jgi:hypothetical protein
MVYDPNWMVVVPFLILAAEIFQKSEVLQHVEKQFLL